ncbi:MAG: hypothetical protein RL594_243 [Bacteroidota bacterium]
MAGPLSPEGITDPYGVEPIFNRGVEEGVIPLYSRTVAVVDVGLVTSLPLLQDATMMASTSSTRL